MRNNPNGQRHLSELKRSKYERSQLAKATVKLLMENYSRREMVKIFYLAWEGREIRFSPLPGLSTSEPTQERDLPPVLRELLKTLYPAKEQPDPSDATDDAL